MVGYYVKTSAGLKGPFSVDQVRSMRDKGTLPGTLRLVESGTQARVTVADLLDAGPEQAWDDDPLAALAAESDAADEGPDDDPLAALAASTAAPPRRTRSGRPTPARGSTAIPVATVAKRGKPAGASKAKAKGSARAKPVPKSKAVAIVEESSGLPTAGAKHPRFAYLKDSLFFAATLPLCTLIFWGLALKVESGQYDPVTRRARANKEIVEFLVGIMGSNGVLIVGSLLSIACWVRLYFKWRSMNRLLAAG